MSIESNIFKRYVPDWSTCKKEYEISFLDNSFKAVVKINKNGEVSGTVYDIENNDEFLPLRVESLEGSFVGKVREEYENILSDISEKFFETDVFTFAQSKQILNYAMEKYGTEPEYLWEKFPRNAVCRRKDNKKWYFAVLSVKGSTLGLPTDDIMEVVDLRADKKDVPELLQQNNIFPAYHMNKKSWITIILDGSMGVDKVFNYIDKSYELAKK